MGLGMKNQLGPHRAQCYKVRGGVGEVAQLGQVEGIR